MIWLLLACSGDEPDQANWNGHRPVDTETGLEDSAVEDSAVEDSAVEDPYVAVQALWDARCIEACHDDDTPSARLNLTLGSAELVDVASVTLPSMSRVASASLEDSFLWHKLLGTHADLGDTNMGSRMPKQAEALSDAELALVEDWILGL